MKKNTQVNCSDLITRFIFCCYFMRQIMRKSIEWNLFATKCNKYFLDHNWELHCKNFLQFDFWTQFTYPWSALSKIETCNEKYSLQLFSETTKKQSSYSKYKREKIWNFSFTCTYFLKNIKLIFLAGANLLIMHEWQHSLQFKFLF